MRTLRRSIKEKPFAGRANTSGTFTPAAVIAELRATIIFDWESIAAALQAIKCDGDIAVESVTLDVPRIARSAGIWRRMEKTRDEIAYKGLKLLRKTLG